MNKEREKVFLVGVVWEGESKDHFEDSMNELRHLAKTADVDVIDSFVQALKRPNTGTYVGKGKLQEIANLAKSKHVHTLIFNNNLSPSQSRNISDVTRCNVVDRTEIILDISLIFPADQLFACEFCPVKCLIFPGPKTNEVP